jgi:hypothetical protein
MVNLYNNDSNRMTRYSRWSARECASGMLGVVVALWTLDQIRLDLTVGGA